MSFLTCCAWVCLVSVWFVEACGEAQYAVSILTTFRIYRTCVEPQMKHTPLASHVHSSSVCSESLVAVRPDRSSSCEYLTSRGEEGGSQGRRERGRVHAFNKSGVASFEWVGLEGRWISERLQSWGHLRQWGEQAVCREGSTEEGMPKKWGEWMVERKTGWRGRLKELPENLKMEGRGLFEEVFAEVKRVGLAWGNHWIETKGVPGTKWGGQGVLHSCSVLEIEGPTNRS